MIKEEIKRNKITERKKGKEISKKERKKKKIMKK